MWIAAVAGALLVAAAAGGIAWAMSRDSGTAATSGACTVRTIGAQGQGHVERLPEDFEPASFPRVTGPHSAQTVVFGEYDRPVPELNVVHNLEHGAVVVRWGQGISPETENAIRAWYRRDARGLIIAPLPANEQAESLRGKITLAAWVAELEDEDDPASEIVKQEGKLAVCDEFDEDAFDDFVDRYGFRGPERFERDQLQPGAG
jgi:uncharacterized protein DUF3105